MGFRLEPATADDVAGLVQLHTAVAEDLTNRFGHGPWSGQITDRGVLFGMRNSQVFVLRNGLGIEATLRLTQRKPWAIDTGYFTKCRRPLYLLSMAVTPASQRRRLGSICIEEAKSRAKAWPADAIRLDAYDAAAGAGDFYRKCGFTEVGRAIYRDVPLIYFELLI